MTRLAEAGKLTLDDVKALEKTIRDAKRRSK
jgi:hypothetical protein